MTFLDKQELNLIMLKPPHSTAPCTMGERKQDTAQKITFFWGNQLEIIETEVLSIEIIFLHIRF